MGCKKRVALFGKGREREKEEKKATIEVRENSDSWSANAFHESECPVSVYSQPTRARAIAMVCAALEAGGYSVEEES